MSDETEHKEPEPINTGSMKRVQLLKDTGAIEAAIQKAIEVCWDAIPQERRDAETLQMEMMRLTSEKVRQFLSSQK